MRRLVRAAGGILVILPLACRERPQTHVVDVRNFAYEPATLDIQAGDTLAFVNHDIVPHTATARDQSWDTESIATADTVRVVAGASGDYFCAFHPSMMATVAIR